MILTGLPSDIVCANIEIVGILASDIAMTLVLV